jgi:hypothetical protein
VERRRENENKKDATALMNFPLTAGVENTLAVTKSQWH